MAATSSSSGAAFTPKRYQAARRLIIQLRACRAGKAEQQHRSLLGQRGRREGVAPDVMLPMTFDNTSSDSSFPILAAAVEAALGYKVEEEEEEEMCSEWSLPTQTRHGRLECRLRPDGPYAKVRQQLMSQPGRRRRDTPEAEHRLLHAVMADDNQATLHRGNAYSFASSGLEAPAGKTMDLWEFLLADEEPDEPKLQQQLDDGGEDLEVRRDDGHVDGELASFITDGGDLLHLNDFLATSSDEDEQEQEGEEHGSHTAGPLEVIGG